MDQLDHQSFMEGAIWELLLLSLFIGAPALIAVIWEKHKIHRKGHHIKEVRDEAAREGIIERRSNVRIIPPSEQKTRDDHIFNTVEEYRNDAD